MYNMMICNNNSNTTATTTTTTSTATTTTHGTSKLNNKSNVLIKCEQRGCVCDSFTDGSHNKRVCENCKHGWVLHGKRN